MNVAALFQQLLPLDITLSTADGQLRYRAPGGLPNDLRELIVEHKPEIIERLQLRDDIRAFLVDLGERYGRKDYRRILESMPGFQQDLVRLESEFQQAWTIGTNQELTAAADRLRDHWRMGLQRIRAEVAA